ncbi:unnamed protein product [Rhizoctonia solani]|uniref:Uncharacterized protein n=1 Tax=Rhizoctonia solani TaxID=456999 RepID=A0A8H3BJ05_9AGAM|nr:unnamed protein product [Rhizoctonia solani]
METVGRLGRRSDLNTGELMRGQDHTARSCVPRLYEPRPAAFSASLCHLKSRPDVEELRSGGRVVGNEGEWRVSRSHARAADLCIYLCCMPKRDAPEPTGCQCTGRQLLQRQLLQELPVSHSYPSAATQVCFCRHVTCVRRSSRIPTLPLHAISPFGYPTAYKPYRQVRGPDSTTEAIPTVGTGRATRSLRGTIGFFDLGKNRAPTGPAASCTKAVTR